MRYTAKSMSSMPTGKTWKLLGSLVLIPGLCVVLPLAMSHFRLMGPLQERAALMLAVTALGLAFKILCTDLLSGAFEYNKHGHDFCLLTMGAAMAAGALQLASDRDLFPGFANVWPWGWVADLTSSPVQQRLIVIFCVFSVSCFFSVLTARISRSIRDRDTKAPDMLSLVNFVLGSAVFSCNLLLLVTKG